MASDDDLDAGKGAENLEHVFCRTGKIALEPPFCRFSENRSQMMRIKLIPIAGMVLGNTMSAIAVAIDRLYMDMDSRSSEIFALVALGATPREAALPSIRSAVNAGMLPTLASMSAADIVQIPG